MDNKTKEEITKRAARFAAYERGEYRFLVPPVCTAGWNDAAWCNHVHFDNPKLNGFLEYNAELDRQARQMINPQP